MLYEGRRPTIAVDIDGVIADYSAGWQGEGIIGAPLPGAKKFLERLREAGWEIIIHTTRGTDEVAEYCKEHGLVYDQINDNANLRGRNPGKPIASVYLDDRAVKFNGDYDQAFKEIINFDLWYSKG